MIGENGYFVTERLREMIKKYANKPEIFFKDDGKVNEEYLDKLIDVLIDITLGVRSGKARIKNTRIAVCDIIADTWSIEAPKQYILEKMYAPPFPKEGVDAAYAFLIRFHDKVAKDFSDFSGGRSLPKDLYS